MDKQGIDEAQYQQDLTPSLARFGPLPEDMHQRLEQATAEEIDVWADRALA